MKKITYLFLVTLLTVNCENESVTQQEDQACDNGTFVGNVILSTQQEVDEFGAMCYTKIEGRLQIGFSHDESSNITDLSPLSNLVEIASPLNSTDVGGLSVSAYNLTSLNGLHNLTTTPSLRIDNCNELINLNGLLSLQEVTGFVADAYEGLFWIIENNKLTSLEGLNNLTRIGYNSDDGFDVRIRGNGLESLSGLDNLISIKGQTSISGLTEISSMEGLNNLQSVEGFFAIGSNYNLLNLNGLENLQYVGGDFYIGANFNLLNLDALSNLTEVNGTFRTLAQLYCTNCTTVPIGNENLIDFCGLNNLFSSGNFQEVEIIDNAYNPTVQDIIDGNCSQ